MSTTSRSPIHPSWAALLLALIMVLAAPLRPAVAEQDPVAFVAALGTQGVEALASSVFPSERLARLRALLQQDFDVGGIGLFALGRYRLSATPQEQQEFFKLYPDFTVRALGRRLEEYGGARFRVIGSRIIGGEMVVSSEIVRSDGRHLLLDWYLIESGGQYKISDVNVAGLSMKIALRDQFASWIETNGGRLGALLAVLRQQIAQVR